MHALNGFVKIHRKLLQWGWYQDNAVKGVFLHLLLTARFDNGIWMGKEIKAGQVIIGTEQLAKDLGFTRQQIRTALNKLKSTNEITIQPTNKYSIITLVNWSEYQEREILQNDYNKKNDEKKLEKSTNKITNKYLAEILESQGLADEQIETITNKITNEQPTNNQQITNNQPQRKNDKNDKNIYNEHFENIWRLFPNKKGKGQVSDTKKKELAKIPLEEWERIIKRYKNDLSKDDWRKPQYGSTFFNSGYVDYTDENYKPYSDTSKYFYGGGFPE